MLQTISITLTISIALIFLRLIKTNNNHEKILGFYFIFTNATILILANSITSFENILDIAIILLLLETTTILFLTSKRKQKD